MCSPVSADVCFIPSKSRSVSDPSSFTYQISSVMKISSTYFIKAAVVAAAVAAAVVIAIEAAAAVF